MKGIIVPTGREVLLKNDDFIVSKTDTKGRIVYVNREFMRISGFSESELLGRQHNIIRHPGMPRGIFKLLWDFIAAGNECFAYVKNLCKNGDHYWVLAHVTPDFNKQGEIIGFFSVRRKPNQHAVDYFSQLYEKLIKAEQEAGTRRALAASSALIDQAVEEQGFENYQSFILSR
ncbi:MAG: PAS domain-containing protein [Candidatus Thiodiazotropha sp. (ex Ctena orbiculata)]|uniref:PAS domain-containing protein n=1 Tax=Candidatus Thiodiazotropha taylori TaxID=2792791 RepID=A0A944M915_9GAMM|nr:PAS domain-containing protein [Candidatus Thiodiazotropha taylori]MBT2989032.1 PAS domain-containing protein [Candidatus Thiodiazotropha taylori]MBT2996322.1 PAS domain-containing protein [Candidatus Thiodiazotropha taylori]MBT3000244.1 PAS domain-containing protein [Candidatus Thiodiazotropha taylori]MBT3028158.1 PAS domain-containing protein [Candidatus Thiodiazotropha taylori]